MSNNSTVTLINDGIEFDWDALQTVPDDCYLIALDQQQIAILLSSLRYAEAKHLWRWSDTATWTADVEPWVNELKGALLMGCNINDLVTQLSRIGDALERQTVGDATTTAALDQVAASAGVTALWDAAKVGLAATFPELAIPIAIGLDVIKNLVDNSNSTEAEISAIAFALGSTASIPD